MNNRIVFCWRIAWCLCLSLILGCTNDYVPVSGTVEYEGKPLVQGIITFHPEAAELGGVGVSLIVDGSYTIRTGNREGVRPGKYRVTVASLMAPSSNMPNALPILLTPQQYSRATTSPLRYIAPATGGRFDIVLDTK